MRAALGVFACLTLAACWDFDALLNQCDAGLGPCTPDAGEAPGGGAGGGAGGGGGGSMGGGGGTDAGAMDAGAMDAGASDAGTATPDCAAGVAATLQTPDGSTAFCFNGFAWENPLPHGADLSAVWGPNPRDVWAGGAAGMLMHWDGTRWTSHQGEIGPQPVPAASRLGWITSIASSSAGAWLAGNDLQPHRLDGGVWYPSAATAGSGVSWRVATLGVSPSGTKGPFAVTNSGEVYAAPNWTLVWAGPTGGRPDNVCEVAVGDDGLVAFSGTYLVGQSSVHRVWNIDGGTWTFDAGEPGALWLEQGQLLTASTNRIDPASATLWVLTDAGATQRISYSDDVVFSAAHFLPGLDAGFLVGSRGTVADTWGNQLTTGRDFELRGVWAFEDGGSWAVGTHGALVHEDTGQWVWRQQGFTEDFFGLWVTDAGNVFLAGGGAYVTDRTTWARKIVGTGTLRDLHRTSDGGWLVASEDGNLWRSGAGIGAIAWQGLMSEPLNGLLVDDDQAWAVGINTVVHRQVDGGWVKDVPADVSGRQDWWKVARAGDRLVVAGARGYAAVYALDAGWASSAQELTKSPDLYGVWAIDGSTAWLVGGGPTIWLFHADTGAFDEQVLPADLFGSLFDVWGSAPDDVWAVGSDGLAFHFDGTEWTPQETGTRARLERVRSRPLPGGGREVIIVGQRGTVLRKRY